MKTQWKILVVLAVAAAVVAAVALKNNRTPTTSSAEPAGVSATSQAALPAAAGVKLPKVVDLGAGKCVPCKIMAPMLEELKREYAGRMEVEFIDTWVNPDAAKPYGIQIIPTQIFFDADGKELFRHEGFFSKEDILAKWNELGVDVTGKPKSGTTPALDTNQPKP
jgi:thioredoxin 1